MNIKLILPGIALVALLVACTKKNDVVNSELPTQNMKNVVNRTDIKRSEKAKGSDTLSKSFLDDTIDPTKPDRPR
ncbi:hypothetical protein TH53_13005 [Pedobacter lusitanus]|uniref:Lipoprotein n=1 Tax=Pedobacter lusitanus TaxID=1503925 RepID=A0A0D0GKX7_9SPHI|nr:hypothetical protein [Pedobacter lusitanus]KIO76830.1 hypothetical protein TH53_13005 [Pedobacter lusitanus]